MVNENESVRQDSSSPERNANKNGGAGDNLAKSGKSSHSKSSSPVPASKPFKLKRRNTKKEQSFSLGTKITMLSLIVVPLIAYITYSGYVYCFVLPNLVKTISDLPRVSSSEQLSNNTNMLWGTYGANLYFGMRTRSSKTPSIGLMWFEQPKDNFIVPKIRHWCSQHDGILHYGWLRHDGRSFGRQMIVERQFTINTTFVKRDGGKHGGDWTARIDAAANEGSDDQLLVSFIVYVALPGGIDGWLKPRLIEPKGDSGLRYIEMIEGGTSQLGKFRIRFSKAKNVVAKSYLSTEIKSGVDFRFITDYILRGSMVFPIKSIHMSHYMGLMGNYPENVEVKEPNLLALQMTVLRSTSFEIVFESESFDKQRPWLLESQKYSEVLEKKEEEFDVKFEKAFGLKQKQYAPVYIEMGQLALSNMLGSISYFYGYAQVQSIYTKQPVPYGPLQLLTAVPSRPFFPRGFLWDEGYHHLLIRKFDKDLSLEILGSWLDLMNIEGWIPRELILGPEAMMKVPPEFLVQNNFYANPPMFFYTISKHLDDAHFAERHRSFFKSAYPRLKLWYNWLNSTQIGPVEGSYRWRGRNSTTTKELNPKTLTSGLDDYPRASHPTDDEYHLDLYCWMYLSSDIMSRLANFVNESSEDFGITARRLRNEKLLDSLHWSDKSNRYCDFGKHTRNVKLERPKVHVPPGAPPPPLPEMQRQVLSEPKLRLVADTFGYISLFPMLIRILSPNSPKLGIILNDLDNPDLLWTQFGLRSMAITSPLYMARNTEHDPPYWRGSIWININYLCIEALHYYSQLKGPYREKAFELYAKLRGALVGNVVRQYARTGYLWEHYNDQTGEGEGSHPFTGWSSLVLLMMSEDYR